jgi:hypothetical protein
LLATDPDQAAARKLLEKLAETDPP